MIYFASDTHLGLNYGSKTPQQREKIFTEFLRSIEDNCSELFLVGDIFDFWFEWNRAVPKGFVRVLAQLQSMCESGTTIHFLPGNHDLWLGTYLHEEIGLTLHKDHLLTSRQGKTLYIAHGDKLHKHKGLSRIIEVVCRSRVARWISQRIIHPDSMIKFGRGWSQSNKVKRGDIAHIFTGESDNWVNASRQILNTTPVDYFVYGHLHTPVIYELNEKSKMVVLGEWVENPTFGVMQNGEIRLEKFYF